jgi:hypothetical protein
MSQYEITTTIQADLDVVDSRLDVLIKVIADKTVECEEDAIFLQNLQGKIKGYENAVVAMLKDIKAEANKAHKAITSVEKKAKAKAQQVYDAAGDKVIPWKEMLAEEKRIMDVAAALINAKEQAKHNAGIAEEVKRIEEEEGSEAAEEYADAAEAYEPAYVPPMAMESPKGTRELKHYSAVVFDEALVPIQYRSVDMQKLNLEARTAKDDFDVPGCRIVVKKTNSVPGEKRLSLS